MDPLTSVLLMGFGVGMIIGHRPFARALKDKSTTIDAPIWVFRVAVIAMAVLFIVGGGLKYLATR